MKRGLFGRLAVQGIFRNRRATLPYMLSCTGIVMMAFLMPWSSVNVSNASSDLTESFSELKTAILASVLSIDI